MDTQARSNHRSVGGKLMRLFSSKQRPVPAATTPPATAVPNRTSVRRNRDVREVANENEAPPVYQCVRSRQRLASSTSSIDTICPEPRTRPRDATPPRHLKSSHSSTNKSPARTALSAISSTPPPALSPGRGSPARAKISRRIVSSKKASAARVGMQLFPFKTDARKEPAILKSRQSPRPRRRTLSRTKAFRYIAEDSDDEDPYLDDYTATACAPSEPPASKPGLGGMKHTGPPTRSDDADDDESACVDSIIAYVVEADRIDRAQRPELSSNLPEAIPILGDITNQVMADQNPSQVPALHAMPGRALSPSGNVPANSQRFSVEIRSVQRYAALWDIASLEGTHVWSCTLVIRDAIPPEGLLYHPIQHVQIEFRAVELSDKIPFANEDEVVRRIPEFLVTYKGETAEPDEVSRLDPKKGILLAPDFTHHSAKERGAPSEWTRTFSAKTSPNIPVTGGVSPYFTPLAKSAPRRRRQRSSVSPSGKDLAIKSCTKRTTSQYFSDITPLCRIVPAITEDSPIVRQPGFRAFYDDFVNAYSQLYLVKPILIQECMSKDPWKVLVAVSLLNVTTGREAIPVFFDVIHEWPTPEALSQACPERLKNMIKQLGLGNKRTEQLIGLSTIYITRPPSYDQLFPSRHYIGAPGTPQRRLYGATAISHLPGCGPYAYDSYRIFCGKADEWKLVMPSDKELTKYLRWKWAFTEFRQWDPQRGPGDSVNIPYLRDLTAYLSSSVVNHLA
ncbi:hypothetical protein A0H81_00011 [Grifola frondosa]|uniref:HhH-GPD domain-containing protein n=1 Tax=Grifola frondosa TaxID=5627 RepID=A0A1C7MRA5_GRIFR|nr:hypothetical protein A0H81_00011 [Grifola frondosa]